MIDNKVNKDTITRNRELSWLKFNERVLEEALEDIPLLEKLKYIAIFMSNFEEFYMVRVGSLTDKKLLKSSKVDINSGWSTEEQLKRIYVETRRLLNKKDKIYKNIETIMEAHGIFDLNYNQLKETEKEYVKEYYETSIMPILSPQIIESTHPFPFLLNNNSYLVMRATRNKKDKFAIMAIPTSLPKIVILNNKRGLRYIRIENIIKEYVDKLYSNYKIKDKVLINITRNADLDEEEVTDIGDEDFKDVMQEILKKRKRLQAVRILADNKISSYLERVLFEKLNLDKEHLFITDTPIKMSYVFQLEDYIKSNKNLLFKSFKPQNTPDIDLNKSIINQIQKKDLLLIYPFEDMEPLISLLNEAKRDKRVKSIQITVYRLAENSRIINNLVKAAENGIEVTVLIELRARFDEQSNINYSKVLKEAGCNVIYGPKGHKVHSKICLITLMEKEEISYITQVGTGNYNEKTSKLYTDICYITSNQIIGEDAVKFFNNMNIGNLNGIYEEILTAPNIFKDKLLEFMDDEITKGKDGRIFIKCNSLSDMDVMQKIYLASQKGCKVKLIVRGICCLKPGLPNVEIHSIVGRFLEHSRVYMFGKNDDCKVYISSADLMTRNTQRRVEIAIPIYNQKIKDRLIHYMDIQWLDDIKGRVHLKEKDYARIITNINISSQDYFMNEAIKNSKNENNVGFWDIIKSFIVGNDA